MDIFFTDRDVVFTDLAGRDRGRGCTAVMAYLAIKSLPVLLRAESVAKPGLRGKQTTKMPYPR